MYQRSLYLLLLPVLCLADVPAQAGQTMIHPPAAVLTRFGQIFQDAALMDNESEHRRELKVNSFIGGWPRQRFVAWVAKQQDTARIIPKRRAESFS